MHSTHSQLPHDSSSATRRGTAAVSGARGRHLQRETAGVRHYVVPSEQGLSLAVGISIGIFVLAVLLAGLLPPEEKLPPMIEVELGIDAVENEPPPLGEPDAGVGEQVPEPVTEPEPVPEAEVRPPEPIVEPEPEPVPEPEPEMEQEPAPEPKPEFVVPKEEPPPEPAPKPKPKPKPVAKVPPKPQKPVRTEAPAVSAPAGSGLSTGRTGVRGSPGGQAGGRGGGRGDFISTPHPQYDATAKQRRYQGRGLFVIRYENGRIVSVSAAQSTGVPYLDSRSIAWISSRWRVKKGSSGAATLPITWQLR